MIVRVEGWAGHSDGLLYSWTVSNVLTVVGSTTGGRRIMAASSSAHNSLCESLSTRFWLVVCRVIYLHTPSLVVLSLSLSEMNMKLVGPVYKLCTFKSRKYIYM